MNARTLMSFCQSAPRNPSQAEAAVAGLTGGTAVTLISDSNSPPRRRAAAGNIEQRARVPGDHQLFVGRNDPRRHAAGKRRNSRPVPVVGARVELDAEPCR